MTSCRTTSGRAERRGDACAPSRVPRDDRCSAGSATRSTTSPPPRPARFAILDLRRARSSSSRCCSRCRSRRRRASRRRSSTRCSPPSRSICVTGLSTVDMATYWSPFGHVLVFIGVEIGGIGVLTLASILGPGHLAAGSGCAQKLHRRRATPTRCASTHGPGRRGAGGAARRDRQPARAPSRSACS